MIQANLQTVGLQRLLGKFSNRINFLGGPGMRDVCEEMGEELMGAFKKEIRSWTPGRVQDLAESTKKQKMREVGTVYPILVRTHRFMDSMYMRIQSARNGGGWVFKLSFRGSQGGVTNARIAEIHINGEGNNPPRDFTRIPQSWKQSFINRVRAAMLRIQK